MLQSNTSDDAKRDAVLAAIEMGTAEAGKMLASQVSNMQSGVADSLMGRENTILHMAVRKAKPKLVKELLKGCPERWLSHKDANGQTPYDIASKLGVGRAQLLVLLSEAQKDHKKRKGRL